MFEVLYHRLIVDKTLILISVMFQIHVLGHNLRFEH